MKNITKFKTADLCDLYSENLIILHQQFKSYGKTDSFCGQIVTIKCLNDNSKVREAVNTNGCNKVLVVDGNASTECALLGDMLAEAACKNNWSGIIINGCIRDSDVIANIDVGVLFASSKPCDAAPCGFFKKSCGPESLDFDPWGPWRPKADQFFDFVGIVFPLFFDS